MRGCWDFKTFAFLTRASTCVRADWDPPPVRNIGNRQCKWLCEKQLCPGQHFTPLVSVHSCHSLVFSVHEMRCFVLWTCPDVGAPWDVVGGSQAHCLSVGSTETCGQGGAGTHGRCAGNHAQDIMFLGL